MTAYVCQVRATHTDGQVRRHSEVERQALTIMQTYMMEEQYRPYEKDLAIFQSPCIGIVKGTISAQACDK